MLPPESGRLARLSPARDWITRALQDMERALHDVERPQRLSRVFDYAEDRAAFLDVRDAVAEAIDATHDIPTEERAELLVAYLRDGMERTLTRRLATEPRIREMVATAMVTAVLP